jgi:hypothetical protein
VPEKVTIAYRGAKYEIGRGKRYYGIWVTGAPASDPIDRWPENSDGWNQAWARFTAIEAPAAITQIEKPRAGIKLPVRKQASTPDPDSPGVRAARGIARRIKLTRATAAAGLIGAGVLLGLTGLFPGYVLSPGTTGSQSLTSSVGQLAPHLIYLVAWAASSVLIALGARRPAESRFEMLRLGALLGSGLSAVTFGLFFSDLGQVIAGGSSLLGTGLILSLLGWFACAAGSVLALFARPRVESRAQPADPEPGQAGPPAADPAQPQPAQAGPPAADPAQPQPAQAPSGLAGPWYAPPVSAADTVQAASPPGQPTQPQTAQDAPARRVGPTFAYPAAGLPSPSPGATAAARFAGSPVAARSGGATAGRAALGGPVRPRMADAGPIALVLLAAIGAVAAFAPSWDSFTFTQPATGAVETITQGNAFALPGAMIAGNVAVMIAVVAIAVIAALWRPIRHGAVLLAGATIPLAAQAISALIGVSEPATPQQFGISPSAGVTITAGLTPIFWVYCVFVISLVVSCAWMLTAPRYPAMPAVSTSPAPGPVHVHPAQGVDDEDDDSDDDDAEDDAQSTYA